MCRDEFETCEYSGESIYAIAPFWSNVNNVLSTQNTSISYQAFERSNCSHSETFEHVWSWISHEHNMVESIQFFPTWMLVAHWQNVHPYIRPNQIDPRVSFIQIAC